MRSPMMQIQQRRFKKQTGCSESYCFGPDRRHGECDHCGERTCSRAMAVNKTTLRRQMVMRCFYCSYWGLAKDGGATRRRAENDWTRPIPDQYPGITRQTIRKFLDGDSLEWVLGDEHGASSIPTLNQSIAVLGFQDVLYAEQRANRVVLRRVPARVASGRASTV